MGLIVPSLHVERTRDGTRTEQCVENLGAFLYMDAVIYILVGNSTLNDEVCYFSQTKKCQFFRL